MITMNKSRYTLLELILVMVVGFILFLVALAFVYMLVVSNGCGPISYKNYKESHPTHNSKDW